ncbi:DUF5695 domain-containing protein [Lentisphaera marina]|uniref:DUF5695 domain-containing protein n=1 Tax=Lentisphaera marina TaxID=1111041 RepID=UPI00236515DB|nr:DUF5695 domain-containing protein [Lentisphaera marina]MDD7985999.1 DUF5695 domain-containing protein [Lentisphaera marina]
MTQNPPREFIINEHEGQIKSLKRKNDPFETEFIRPGNSLGSLNISYKQNENSIDCDEKGTQDLHVSSCFSQSGPFLDWDIHLKNNSHSTLEIGTLETPFKFNEEYTRNPKESFEGRVFKHSQIAGHNSFIFWLPVGGLGSHLLMTPKEETHLEFFEAKNGIYASGGALYSAFIHSKTHTEKIKGTWRQENSSKLIPAQETVSYSFRFQWCDNYADIREKIYQSGGIDIRVAPGMVIPRDNKVKIALRSQKDILQIIAEFTDHTEITKLSKRGDYDIYELQFEKLGENKLILEYGTNQESLLEFFITEDLETLIKKRASFITNSQQHIAPDKWYDGLYSLWDASAEVGKQLLGPDNPGSQHPYCVSGSDDPSNSKCIYLAEKNVAYPDAQEIASLEYFIKNFVWGKHQRSDQEDPYPYGIYGSDSWINNRNSQNDLIEESTSRPQEGGSQCRMWRSFDYTTYFALYYNMYLIAQQNPELTKYLSANDYLERAYGTAKAYFEVPYNIMMTGGWAHEGWTDWAYTLGNFHEKYLLPLITSLREEGFSDKADYLEGEWEKKVKYFLYDDDYPFVSEMPVDSTAYESSYAIGKYALTNTLEADNNLWQHKNTGQWFSHPIIDEEKHKDYLHRQLMANLACRGVLESSYYHYGSDFRAVGTSNYTMSYMSQMGGWAIMDQGLYFEENKFDLIQLGYASLLCSWGLVNSGTDKSNYGYWYGGKNNDGSVAWGFMPQMQGSEWNSACDNMSRGPWAVCGEIDHGLCAGVEAAACIAVDDPIFGPLAYGGDLQTRDNELQAIPLDGVRRQFHYISQTSALHLNLKSEGFKKGSFITWNKELSLLSFTIEKRSQQAQEIKLELQGLHSGEYELLVGKNSNQKFTASKDTLNTLSLNAEGDFTEIKIRKISP